MSGVEIPFLLLLTRFDTDPLLHGVIARMMHLFATTTSEQVLELGKTAGVTEVKRPPVGGFAAAARNTES